MLINLTPHDLIVALPDGTERVIPKSGHLARVSVRSQTVEAVDGVPASRALYGPVEGLPEPEPGTVYIVSALVGARVAGQRDDIYGPDTGPTAIRDERGQIRAVRGLIKY